MNKKRKLLIVGIFYILIGVGIIIAMITREKIYSKYDLVEIKARLQNYSFIKYGGFLKPIYSYHLFLEKYNNEFIILTDYVKYFDKLSFEQLIRPGDSVMIELYSKDFKNISVQNKVRIYGLSGNHKTFLNFNDTIRENSSQVPAFFGVFAIIGGIIALFIFFDK
jgi:hypothetical protein